jgi:hypothetical protein
MGGIVSYSTLIYARTHDQIVADNYFSAMQQVEQRLQVGGKKVVMVQGFQFEIAKLELGED